jgi:hypothetical protein
MNKRLTQNLISDKTDPIYCNNILNSNRFEQPINTIETYEEDFEIQRKNIERAAKRHTREQKNNRKFDY